MVIQYSVRDARFIKEGSYHRDAEKGGVAQGDQKQKRTCHVLRPVVESCRKKDDSGRDQKHDPRHYDWTQDVSGKSKFWHLEQDQGRQGDINNKEVEHLSGFLGKLGQAAQSHADEQKGNGENEIFHGILLRAKVKKSRCLG